MTRIEEIRARTEVLKRSPHNYASQCIRDIEYLLDQLDRLADLERQVDALRKAAAEEADFLREELRNRNERISVLEREASARRAVRSGETG